MTGDCCVYSLLLLFEFCDVIRNRLIDQCDFIFVSLRNKCFHNKQCVMSSKPVRIHVNYFRKSVFGNRCFILSFSNKYL